MKKLLPVLVVISLLLIACLSSVPAITYKYGTDGSGDSWFGPINAITNSNGGCWEATETGLQDAIDDLNNESGWVDGGNNNISISSTIYLGTGCKLRNVELYLVGNSDCTMIENYDITNGNDDIKIYYVTLDGNEDGQTADDSVGSWDGTRFNIPFGIYLINCDNVEISHCNVSNIQLGGIYVQESEKPNIHHNHINKIGDSFDAGDPADCYTAGGIYLFNTTKGIVSKNHIVDTYAFGICVESTLPSVTPYRCHYTLVDGNYVENTSIAFYCEDAENITFSNNIVNEIYLKDSDLFGGGAFGMGFFAKAGGNVNKLTYIGNQVHNGRSTGCRGFNIHSNNSKITDSLITNFYRGIHYGGCEGLVSNNHIEGTTQYSIYFDTAENVTCTQNICQDWGGGSAAIRISSLFNSLVMMNTMLDNVNIGIYGSNSDNGNFVLFNHFENVNIELYQVGDRVNCTGYADWNFYTGVS